MRSIKITKKINIIHNKLLKFITACILMLCVFSNVLAQKAIDDIKKSGTTNLKEDTTQINILLNKAADNFSINSDSSKIYIQNALFIAKTIEDSIFIAKCYYYKSQFFKFLNNFDSTNFYLKKSIETVKEISQEENAFYLTETANFYLDEGLYFQSIKLNEEALEIFVKQNNTNEQAKVLLKIGTVNHFQGNYSISLNYYQQALELFESIDNLKMKAQCYNNIGMVHETQENFQKAIDFFNIALDIYVSTNDSLGYSRSLNNKGICYGQKGDLDSAKIFFLESLEIDEKIGDINGIGLNYMNLGNIKYFTGEEDSALVFWQKGYENNLEAKDYQNATACLNNLGYAYFLSGKAEKATEIFEKIIETSLISGAKENIQLAYNNLSEVYSEAGDYKKALECTNLAYLYSDSLTDEAVKKEILEIEAKYETEKQIQLIEIQNIEIEKQKAEIKIQTNKKYTFIAGFFFMIILALIILRSNFQKKKTNKILLEKNAEINQKNEEILTQNEALHQQKEEIRAQSENLQNAYDEIIAQRDLISTQKNEIELKNFNITSSIEYAQRIQEVIISNIDKISAEHFIYIKPRDIVSGDFYFVKNFLHITVIGVADCTGHGVPGAFMSILGITFLNEIFSSEINISAAEALNILREKIKNALKQTGKKDEQKDGMDISLCINNKEINELEYAGANLPVYILRKNDENNELFELLPDRQPIGIYVKETPFNSTKFKTCENDIIYLFSDGYYSQFGGEFNEIFKLKRFKELIKSVGSKNLDEQFVNFDETLENWKSKKQQVDDILVMAIKL